MDALQIFEQACKSVRFVKRGVGAYLGEVRRVYEGALEEKRLDEECPFCGNPRSERVCGAGGLHGGEYPEWTRDADALAAWEAERDVSEPTAFQEFEADVKARYGLNPAVTASPGGAPTAGDDPVGVSDGIPPLSPPTGTPNPSRITVGAARDEGSPAVCDLPSSPAGERPNVDAISATLAGHVFEHGELLEDRGLCSCGKCPWDWAEWRAHVAPIIASRLECLAADRRVADRLDAAGFAAKVTEVPATVTRVVVVNKHPAEPPLVERWAESWDLYVQDNGRTLKLFPQNPTERRYEHTPGFWEATFEQYRNK